jgi:hypothetical protein
MCGTLINIAKQFKEHWNEMIQLHQPSCGLWSEENDENVYLRERWTQ